jgi:hypothetical protein
MTQYADSLGMHRRELRSQKGSFWQYNILRTFIVYRIEHSPKKIFGMKNADRPFIGIIIVTIAVLYSVIALLS